MISRNDVLFASYVEIPYSNIVGIPEYEFIDTVLFAGTNDKAGMGTYLLKWLSPRAIKENLIDIDNWRYPYMDQ